MRLLILHLRVCDLLSFSNFLHFSTQKLNTHRCDVFNSTLNSESLRFITFFKLLHFSTQKLNTHRCDVFNSTLNSESLRFITFFKLLHFSTQKLNSHRCDVFNSTLNSQTNSHRCEVFTTHVSLSCAFLLLLHPGKLTIKQLTNLYIFSLEGVHFWSTSSNFLQQVRG